MTERAAHLVDHVWPLAGQSLDDDGASSDPFADAAPLLAGLAAASAQGVLVVGGEPGRLPQRLGGAGEALFPADGPRSPAQTRTPAGRGSICMSGVAVPGHRARRERSFRDPAGIMFRSKWAGSPGN